MNKVLFKKIKKSKPYLIAEVGVNHENSMSLAEKIIKQAKLGGADAVKFQIYKAEKIASYKSPYYWDLRKNSEKSQYKLFKKYDKFNKEDYANLKKICQNYKLDFLATPFDLDAVNFLDKLVPFFKVASADITNIPLIQKVCETKKPLLISTGGTTTKEIIYIDKFIKTKFPQTELAFMHCVLSYPTEYKDANLEIIKFLKKKFPQRLIGYSDHTIPDENMLVLSKAYELGASIIEKHFTLDKLKGKKGNDHFHSMDLNDLKKFRKNIDFINLIRGKAETRKLISCEKISRKNARRSIVTLGKVKKNTKFTKKNLILKRPGDGISPIHFNKVLNKYARFDLEDDHKITFKDIKTKI
jgi:N-acetylneuraminate synthase